MRKNILYIFALLVTLSLTSCFDDDSTLGNNDVSDINGQRHRGRIHQDCLCG
jgi:outer membrane protein assembly factor BamE (lipoprotein component of BamABCDE complex)